MSENKMDSKREKVVKYLNKTYSELNDEKRHLDNLISVQDAKVKEMYNAISIAEKEIDPHYNLFSPKSTNKTLMNDTLTKEVHLLENELEEMKFKSKKLEEKIDNTRDIISCIVGLNEEEIFKENTNYLDALIESMYERDNNFDNNISEKEKVDNIEKSESESSDFDLVSAVIEPPEEFLFSDEIRMKFLNIQEAEKNRIARDLHDTTVQNLTSLVHKTELCMKLVDMDSVRTKLELQTMINTLKDSINELRHIIYGLKPMSLDDFGLVTTIKRFIEQLNLENGPKFTLNVEGFESKEIEPIVNLTLFRIIQEGCNNAIKHANAENVEIFLEYVDNFINLIIIDDGVGFNSYSNNSNSDKDNLTGFGISIMKERTYLLSGRFFIDYADTKNGKGTKIVVIIPLNDEL